MSATKTKVPREAKAATHCTKCGSVISGAGYSVRGGWHCGACAMEVKS